MPESRSFNRKSDYQTDDENQSPDDENYAPGFCSILACAEFSFIFQLIG